MGKLETNKKVKKNALLQNAFELFTDKGFAKTTISDIVSIYILKTNMTCVIN